MATTRTVGTTGKDHTTLNAAVTWFENNANHDFSSDGIGTISIEEDFEDTTTVAIDLTAGKTSATGYLHITTDSASRHDGNAGTGYRLVSTSTSAHAIEVGTNSTHTIIEGIEVHQNSTGTSREGIRVIAVDCIITQCVIHGNYNSGSYISDQDGIYRSTSSDDGALNIDNCHFYHFGRGGVNHQSLAGDFNTYTWNIDFCTIHKCGKNSGEADGGALGSSQFTSSSTCIFNTYNCLAFECDDQSSECYNSGGDTFSYNGDNNIADDTSAEGKFTSSHDSVTITASEPSSGENAWLVDLTSDTSFDVAIEDENAFTVTESDTSTRTEPDSRQDFSIDIIGTSRDSSAPNIGCFELAAAGGGTTPKGPLGHSLHGAFAGPVGP